MRSSKSRSRNKQNRNRSMGNIVNRVFDSSGPEGKVRGTPQQIIDKYNQLARDAQLSNDRVAAENFQQHAEHYLRLLSEAQREQQERQQQHQQHNGGHDNRRSDDDGNDDDNHSHGGGGDSYGQPSGSGRDERHGDGGRRSANRDNETRGAADVIDMDDQTETSTLVETPEEKPKRARRPRRKPEQVETSGDTPAGEASAEGAVAVPPDAAE